MYTPALEFLQKLTPQSGKTFDIKTSELIKELNKRNFKNPEWKILEKPKNIYEKEIVKKLELYKYFIINIINYLINS